MVASLLPNRDSSVQFTPRFTEVNFSGLRCNYFLLIPKMYRNTSIHQRRKRKQGLTTKNCDRFIVLFGSAPKFRANKIFGAKLLRCSSPCLIFQRKTDRNKSKPEPHRLIDCLTSIGVPENPVKLSEKPKHFSLTSCLPIPFSQFSALDKSKK